MNPNTAFADLGVDALTGTRLMNAFNLSNIDFSNPSRFARFQQIIDFLKQYPEDTQDFLISKVKNGKVGDILDKMFEYSQLLSKKQTFEKDLENIKKESAVLTPDSDPFLRAASAQREMKAVDSIRTVSNEINLYEK